MCPFCPCVFSCSQMSVMNSSEPLDSLGEAVTKNLINVFLTVVINCINGAFVYIYFNSQEFQTDARYVLYIHLVINDMIMLNMTMALQLITYTVNITLIVFFPGRNSPLNLASMAVERYVAVCRPLHHAQMCTVSRAYALIALIWIVSFIPSFSDIIITVANQPLSSLLQTVICHPSYLFNTPNHKVHGSVLLFAFVFLTLVITYTKVFFIARIASSDEALAKNARNTILLHGIQLFICMLTYLSPVVTLTLVTMWPRGRTNILFVSFVFTNVLPRLLSPLVYGVRDTKFRNQIRLLVHCPRCCSVHKKKNLVQVWRRSREVIHRDAFKDVHA
uniref:Si:dkeyp-3f10.16 n=1 Tax=Cynoglossus semilaevis TaxID=244447 RepID=A0A3P8WV05_CYNSE